MFEFLHFAYVVFVNPPKTCQTCENIEDAKVVEIVAKTPKLEMHMIREVTCVFL
jgi:hypothetical protein